MSFESVSLRKYARLEGLGERYSSPEQFRAEPGRQTHFCAIRSPKSVKLF